MGEEGTEYVPSQQKPEDGAPPPPKRQQPPLSPYISVHLPNLLRSP